MLNNTLMLSPLSLSMAQLQDLLQAEQFEVLKLEAEIEKQKRQLLLYSSDDTLSRYERMFAITTSPLASILERQNALVAKFNSRASATVKTITEIVELITCNSCEIVEHPDRYSFDIVIALDNPNSAVGLAEVHNQIDVLKPAHLNYNLSMLSAHQVSVYVGLILSTYKEVII